MYELNVHKCAKFRTFENKADTRRALVFLKLLDNSCPREEALKFCKKRICRFDTTKKLEGPPKFRLIRNATTSRGWIFPEEIKYDLGKNYERPKTEEDRAFQKFFQSNKVKIVQEQQHQVEVVNKFMKEIDGQLNMKYNNLKELKKKVQDVRVKQEEYRNTPVNYLKFKGQRFIQLYDVFKKHYDNDLLGFEKQFPVTVQEKTKRNEDFFVRANKKLETDNLQKKFIKLQNEGEIIAKLTQSEGNKDQGISIKSFQHINDVKNLAMEFNKTQYVFDDEKLKKMKRNSLHLLKLNNKYRKNKNQKDTKIGDFEEKLERIITNRIDSITRSGNATNVDYDQINSLKQKTETARNKEFYKIKSRFTPRSSKMNQRAYTTQQSTRKLVLKSNRSHNQLQK
ncbi:unnamed protein product [Paramecium pentaurelia]|uniref:Uncharacterized protein n=1 Tax=Paramecium pentaurelia TaxID=43138 RepID=A0A8S1TAY8_9CILI|nr:unnamed protein product [Paramecium pentaurelia]